MMNKHDDGREKWQIVSKRNKIDKDAFLAEMPNIGCFGQFYCTKAVMAGAEIIEFWQAVGLNIDLFTGLQGDTQKERERVRISVIREEEECIVIQQSSK